MQTPDPVGTATVKGFKTVAGTGKTPRAQVRYKVRWRVLVVLVQGGPRSFGRAGLPWATVPRPAYPLARTAVTVEAKIA